jgi:hypothetical protein
MDTYKHVAGQCSSAGIDEEAGGSRIILSRGCHCVIEVTDAWNGENGPAYCLPSFQESWTLPVSTTIVCLVSQELNDDSRIR